MKRLAMHICCAICFIEPYKNLVNEGFQIHGFYYNPNIQPFEEYFNRSNTLKYILKDSNLISFVSEEYNASDYNKAVGKDFSSRKEMCKKCYQMRIHKTAEWAKTLNIECFTTTLLGSPYQDFDAICEIGSKIGEIYKINFVSSKNWSKNYYNSKNDIKNRNLHVQKYCGCIYSKMDRKLEKANLV